MQSDKLLRAILPDVLIDNFDVDHFEKTDTRFDIWLDEKKVQLREDKKNKSIISYGFVIITPSRTFRYEAVPLIYMCVSANG